MSTIMTRAITLLQNQSTGRLTFVNYVLTMNAPNHTRHPLQQASTLMCDQQTDGETDVIPVWQTADGGNINFLTTSNLNNKTAMKS